LANGKQGFIFNFAISFIIYAVVNSIGYLTRFALYPFGAGLIFLPCMLIAIGLPTIIYYYSGKKILKLLRNKSQNYLSVSSSFLFAAVVITYFISFDKISEFMFFIVSSYGAHGYYSIFTMLLGSEGGMYVLAALPSITMWLGVWKKSRR